MSERWYYTHQGRELGPVSSAEIKQLASSGKLLPQDILWQEGEDRSRAIEACAAIDFTTLPPPQRPANDIGKPQAPANKPKSGTPDWLDDIRRNEQG